MKTLILCCLFCLSAVTYGAENKAEVLFTTINQRLGYMQDVALYKAQNNLAIENTERELVVLQKAKQAAAAKGLDPLLVAGFFKAQIAAAKAIQYRYRADLLSAPIEKAPLDLNKEIRPALIKLGNQIIEQMGAYIEQHGSFTPSQQNEFFKHVNQIYLSEADKQKLFNGLLKIR
jgi:chorismate mutase